jgi:hypothetical protein
MDDMCRNEHLILDAKIITDVSAYKIIGANNLLDIYPTVNFKTQTVALRIYGYKWYI